MHIGQNKHACYSFLLGLQILLRVGRIGILFKSLEFISYWLPNTYTFNYKPTFWQVKNEVSELMSWEDMGTVFL